LPVKPPRFADIVAMSLREGEQVEAFNADVTSCVTNMGRVFTDEGRRIIRRGGLGPGVELEVWCAKQERWER